MSVLHNLNVRLYVTYVDGLRMLLAMEHGNGNKAYLIKVEPVDFEDHRFNGGLEEPEGTR